MSEIDRSSPQAPQVPDLAGPTRPSPDRAIGERWAAWLAWFGLARLMATAICVVIVALGGYWLVRVPAPPAEATLPVATTAPTTGPDATLPPPTVAADDAPDDQDGPIVVHVAGQVRSPGVYELDESRRVHDAIGRAGGATADADLDVLNLAQPLLDGQRLYVPALGEIDERPIELVSPPTPASGGGGSGGDESKAPVDVNRATTDELETLPGVGPSTAQAIVDDRERNGPFATVDDLERVPGIGPAKLAAIRDLATV